MSANRLTGLDSSFLHLEQDGAHMHVASTMVFEGPAPAYDDFCEHFDKVVTEHLQNTQVAHDFIEGSRRPGPPLQLPQWLHPVWRIATAPMGHFQYLAILGMIPPSARATLGVRWGRSQDFQLKWFGLVVGKVVPMLPERLKYFPIAYEARKLDRVRRERPDDTRAIAKAERKLRIAIDKRPT